ncbi:protein-arginine deiminase domain-containing protein [Caulobacter sp. SL161]|uniref:protein-arginine deiminase domain-containing protein n=1 Tax=Caulobacter sp. SL161 TaxID=2995156 RepID=UPI0022732B79|nr:protein-arginine deiminase domain-containing protein [Caulobacter sp. SL161]MCY1646621.1 protein-arginine deiminase domain-containing protein [Caulobacter sp. SL161]
MILPLLIAGWTVVGADGAARAPVILADTNRDGVVTMADADDKAVWTSQRGAILLPNIGDSAKRCSDVSNPNITDAQLEACNDAEGDVARAPDYFAPVMTLPTQGASNSASGQVAAIGPGAEKIRVFIQRKGKWAYVGPNDRLSAKEVREGARFGVDSRDVVRDAAVWDGRVTLRFTVSDRGQTSHDQVAMRVAPVLVHNHLEKAVDVFAPESGKWEPHKTFISDLSTALKSAGFQGRLRQIPTRDIWAQDFVEFGYVSMPAPGGSKVLRIAIRSPQPTRSAGRALFTLRGPDMGVVQLGGAGYHQTDSFGNLETVPPYEHNGKRYPVGRVIYGDAADGVAPHRDMTTFFTAQQDQAPIMLDTSWLIIGHVDEFVQFLPADTPRGWTIAVKDVASGLALLRDAQRRGFGATKAFSRPDAPQQTIDEVLADKAFLEDNELGRRRVELNLDLLKAETGITESEVVRVPGLFHTAEFAASLPKARQHEASAPPQDAPPPPVDDNLPLMAEAITYGPGSLIAFYPAAVNGLLLDRKNYLPPQQWGPVIDGQDILQVAVEKAYASVGIKAWSIDDWLSHHSWGGEVHCGTNATRTISADWWR